MVEDVLGIIEGFEDFVPIFDISKDKIEASKGLFPRFALILAKGKRHVSHSLLFH
jgi:hypothetical protein